MSITFACVMPGCGKEGSVTVMVPAHLNSLWRLHYCEPHARAVCLSDPGRYIEAAQADDETAANAQGGAS